MKLRKRKSPPRAAIPAARQRIPPGFSSNLEYRNVLKKTVENWPVRNERPQPHLTVGTRVLIVQGNRQDSYCQQGLVSFVKFPNYEVKYKGTGSIEWSTTHKHFSELLVMGNGVELQVGTDGRGSLQTVDAEPPLVDDRQMVPDDRRGFSTIR